MSQESRAWLFGLLFFGFPVWIGVAIALGTGGGLGETLSVLWEGAKAYLMLVASFGAVFLFAYILHALSGR